MSRGSGEKEVEAFAISAHQLVSARDPRAPIRTVIAPRGRGGFPGRPYLLWRHDPELARFVNDSLAGEAD